ncbi:hypothetical protein [Aquimarina muelleri]|uniref:Uncharacterized protein n=1 Tax=Aquimarina muelleri TaxID=279356 RepID=A0A918JUF0_9FLAO|nr:hypothetical protein [Aquimarina muelleri]MCX2763008.1 hypothetical protein [Aquimarina muelleri]GGX15419.1 hypothetical protein GCM10007384_16370 [Aquimarina muelleri]
MKTHFKVDLISFKTINELPNNWTANDYTKLLEALDYGDTTNILKEELKDLCLLSLSDNEPEDAALLVLEYIFKEKLNQGQLDNLSHEMQEEKMWEEYADLSMHEDFFNATQILYEAYNGKFPHPEAVNFKVRLTVDNNNDLELFKHNPEALLIKILIKGMPDNTLIKRLFKEQLTKVDFKEAKDILWQLKIEETKDKSMVFEVITSSYWFKDLKYVSPFEAIFDNEILIAQH